MDTKNLNIIYKIEFFWPIGYIPKFLCCSMNGKYVVGFSEGHRNKCISLSWKEDVNQQYVVKKIEVHSKEKWIGMDISSLESGLVVCSLIDSKASKMRGINTEVYPLAITFTLYDYKSSSFPVIGWQEFFDNRFNTASIMRRHNFCDIFLVGAVGNVGIFHLEGISNFSLLSVISGFGDYPLSDIYFEEKILLLVRNHPALTYPIIYFDLRQDQNLNDDDDSSEKDERENQVELLSKEYLQPNIKYHPINKFKEEVKQYHSILQCIENDGEDLVTIANSAGVSHMLKRDGSNLYEAAISNVGYDLLNMRLLHNGMVIIQTAENLDLIVLDKSAKLVNKLQNAIKPPDHQKIGKI